MEKASRFRFVLSTLWIGFLLAISFMEAPLKFLVSGSETPKAVPSWLWVLLIGFVSWGIFYLVSNVML